MGPKETKSTKATRVAHAVLSEPKSADSPRTEETTATWDVAPGGSRSERPGEPITDDDLARIDAVLAAIENGDVALEGVTASKALRRSVCATIRALIHGTPGPEVSDLRTRAHVHELRPEVHRSPERAEGIRAATAAAARLADIVAALDDPETAEHVATEHRRTAQRARELLEGLHDVNASANRIALAVREEVLRRVSAFFVALSEDENEEIAAAAVYAYGHLMEPGAYAMEVLQMQSPSLAARLSIAALGRMVSAWPSAATDPSMPKAAAHALADTLTEAIGHDRTVPKATSLQNKWNLHGPEATAIDHERLARAVLDPIRDELAVDAGPGEAERAVRAAWEAAAPARTKR